MDRDRSIAGLESSAESAGKDHIPLTGNKTGSKNRKNNFILRSESAADCAESTLFEECRVVDENKGYWTQSMCFLRIDMHYSNQQKR